MLSPPGRASPRRLSSHCSRRALRPLADGAKRKVDFAVPAFGRFFGFRVSKVADLEYRGAPAVRFRMLPSNPFLRLLADPIDLVYDDAGRLREFIGTSNIKDDNGKQYAARIVFEYDSDLSRVASRPGPRNDSRQGLER